MPIELACSVITAGLMATGCSDVSCPEGTVETDTRSCVMPERAEETNPTEPAPSTVAPVVAIDDFSVVFPWNGYATGSLHANPPDSNPPPTHPLRPWFRWTEVRDAATYEIQLTDDCPEDDILSCAFDNPDVDEQAAEPQWRPSAPLAVRVQPPVGTRYYWRARACPEQGDCGAWTEVRYLDVGRAPGDFDGDGYSDRVVGAPKQESEGTPADNTDEGHAYVYYGAPDGLDAGESQVLEQPEDAGGGFFGASVAAAGDLNRDGYSDLAIGAYGAGGQGRVFVFLGSSSGLPLVPSAILENPDDEQDGWFGRAVSGVGDVNGDGFADIAVGAPLQDNGMLDVGRVFLFLGDSSGINQDPTALLDAPSPQPSGEFGIVLSGGGDYDGDGLTDFVVGAPRFNDAAREDVGQAYLYLGSRTATEIALARTLSNPQEQERALFASSLSIDGDLSGDGLADVVVGSPEHDRGANEEGNVFVYFGNRDAGEEVSPLVIDNPKNEVGGFFGSAVASRGDINGDGACDLVVGAMFQDQHSELSNVYLYLGGTVGLAPSTTIYNVFGGAPTDELSVPGGARGSLFGAAVSTTGDVDGDGLADVLVGEPGYDGANDNQGRALLFLGAPDSDLGNAAARLENPLAQLSAEFGYEIQ